ncbi:MAG: M43 family zinc metalloprotease [Vicingaceae bacterium]
MSDQIRGELEANNLFVKHQALLDSLTKSRTQAKSDSILTIPVVFHILHRIPSDSISIAQVFTQLDVLNKDFRKLNHDTTNVESGFSTVDSKIEFCIAKRDPDDEFTGGIVYYRTTIDDIGNRIANPNAIDSIIKVAPIWDRDRYLNIWVCDAGPNLAGFAYPPGSPASIDGVVISNLNFGTIGNNDANFDLGRTATHEVGHWLNLIHPWGTFPSCNNDDRVGDTPSQDVIYSGCPSPPQSSCNSKDMLSNFMGYVYDRCMGNFTQGQSTRMRTALENSRKKILQSKGCLTTSLRENKLAQQLTLYPNPAQDQLTIKIPQEFRNETLELSILNIDGRRLALETKELSIGYQLNIRSLPKGIYFIKVLGIDFDLTKKLIKH